MDAARFDRMTRSLVGRSSRRGVLVGLVGGALGIGRGIVGSDSVAVAACQPGNELCGGACRPVCPPDQVRGSACRCLCRATGRPPGPIGCPCTSSSVCDGGDIVFCGGASLDCLCDRTTSGSLVCSDFFAYPEIPCATNADCPASHSCVTSFDCSQPYCALTCGAPSGARTTLETDSTWDRSDGPAS